MRATQAYAVAISDRARLLKAVLFWALAAGVLWILLGAEAMAAQTPPPVGDCSSYPGLTNKIAACIRNTLTQATSDFFIGFYPLVQKAVTAVITLSVIIVGVMAATQQLEKPGRDVLMVLIKIACVGFFCATMDSSYRLVIRAIDNTSEAVVSFVPTSGTADGVNSFNQVTCLKNMLQAGGSSSVTGEGIAGPWLAMDCIIDSVIGIHIPASGPPSIKAYNEQLQGRGAQRGILNFLFRSMHTSVIGVIFAIIGFIYIWGLLFMIARALFTYLGCYIALTLVMIIGPLFIPLVLFRVTKDYFEKWVKLVIGFSLQPIFLLIFIMMTIVAVDLAMFSGNYSLMYRIAGEATRSSNFNLNKYLEDKGVTVKDPVVLANIKADNVADCATTEVVTKVAGSLKMADEAARTTKPCKTYPYQVMREAVDWEKLANVRNPPVTVSGTTKPGQQILNEIIAAAFFAGIVVFVMSRLLGIVPLIITDMLGELSVTPNLHGLMRIPGQSTLARAASSMGRTIQKGMFGGKK